MFDSIDSFLEDAYGSCYALHPSRPAKGTTSSGEHDGLFNIGVSFSAGFGSKFGKGYVIDVEMVTLEEVPTDVRKKIEEEVVRELNRLLPVYFPERKLFVGHEGNLYKIYGDFFLGSL